MSGRNRTFIFGTSIRCGHQHHHRHISGRLETFNPFPWATLVDPNQTARPEHPCGFGERTKRSSSTSAQNLAQTEGDEPSHGFWPEQTVTTAITGFIWIKQSLGAHPRSAEALGDRTRNEHRKGPGCAPNNCLQSYIHKNACSP